VCVSVNEEVIHGIPSKKKVIRKGDLVSVDLGIEHKGLFVDTAYTYMAGRPSRVAKKLVATTFKSLYCGIQKARAGATIGDVGNAIQSFVERRCFSVIRKFVGHGIGRALHMPPEVPNFGEKNKGALLTEGMVIAIEPMVSAGNYDVSVLEDNWTTKTADDSLSAHFEHTVAITKRGPWVLTH
jgi:methionyl aminopeptidase